MINLPSFAEEHKIKSKKRSKYRKYQITASILLILIIWASVSHVFGYEDYYIEEFYADKYEVDVGETITFHWSVIGEFSWAIVNFGDGNSTILNGDHTSVQHKYQNEGLYNVTLTVKNNTWEDSMSLQGGPHDGMILVKNNPPEFIPSVPNSAYEDEEVTVSVPFENLIESDHDKQPGILTYIYDFSDGETINSTENSVIHTWTNAGTYPVSITVIDDQGALSREIEDITILNKKPEAAFTLGVEIPSTWSFSDDIINKIPFGWQEDAPGSRDAIKVIQGKDSHSKVLEITGNTQAHPEPRIRTYIGTQYYGTVEYWILITNSTEPWGYVSLNSDGEEAISVFINNSKWCYRVNGGTAVNIANVNEPKENQWTHIRIDYIVDKSFIPEINYFRLNEDNEFQVIIDGVISDGYNFASAGVTNINRICLGSHTHSTLGKAYIDSIGTTSDPNYEVGDNFNFYNSSYYATHDFRFDAVGKAPNEFENHIISAQETGEYYGTYSFEDGIPSEWTTGASVSCNVIYRNNLVSGHKGVVMLSDDNWEGSARIYNTFENRRNGTIEFWARTSSEYDRTYFRLYDSDSYPTANIEIRFDPNEYIAYTTSSGGRKCVQEYYTECWHHFRIDWDISIGTWDLYIDGGKTKETGIAFRNPEELDEINQFRISTDAGAWGFDTWIDAIGYSWDPEYSVGDNWHSPYDISVENEINDHKEVVRILDKGDQDNVKMIDNIENKYGNQTSGIIQWYAKSSNINEQAWILTLMDGSNVELSITISEGKWQYSIGGNFENMLELPTPEANVWYSLSLEFNIITGKFQLWVDSTQSNEYNLGGNFDKISKLMFESGLEASGTAWLDAIGYSFDPYYQIDDYLISMISYPEKTNVQFSGADSTDTESDLASLSYYWRFGDNTTAFGKYVTHEFKQSDRYNVSLAVKDDNGDVDYFSQLVLIHNKFPEVNIVSGNSTIEVYEGQTISLACISDDDITDWAELIHFWDFNSSMGILSEEEYKEGGWRMTNLYKDDFNGNVGVMVKDPEGYTSMDFINVIVKNVDPLISIYDASVISNITFEVFRNSISEEANFTFDLYSDDNKELSSYLTFDGSDETSIYSPKSELVMTLSKEWKVKINSTQLPSNSWFIYYLRMQFLDGQELIISSEKIYGDGGNFGEWNVNLNPYFYDNGDYSFKFPITFSGQVFDPSIDDINISLALKTFILLEINSTNSVPVTYDYTEQYSFGNVSYLVNIFQKNDITYANITAEYLIDKKSFIDNDFPVDLDFQFNIFPIIDLYDILEENTGLNQLIILQCVEASNYLIINATDDDNGFNSLTPVFTTNGEIEFFNLSPKLNVLIPDNASTNREINFQIMISDFDQIAETQDTFTSNFKSEDIPSIPDDINVINGDLDQNFGDLKFIDDSYMVVNSNSYELDMDITFKMESINNDEVLKFIRLYSAIKSDIIQVVDLSLYNFHTESYDLILSKPISTSIDKYSYTILSSEYFNSTFHVILKISAVNTSFNFELSINQLRLEFFSVVIHESTYFENLEVAKISSLQGGAIDSYGNLYTQDNDYSEFYTVNIPVGDYTGTESFANEEDGTEGLNIDFIDYYDVCHGSYAKIIGELGGHSKVLDFWVQCNDHDTSIYHNFESEQVSGDVEFWFRTSDVNDWISINFKDESTTAFYLRTYNGYLQAYSAGPGYVNLQQITNNQWYHIRLAYECTSGQHDTLSQYDFNVYVDGTKYGSYNFYNNRPHVDRFDVWGHPTLSSFVHGYFDAIGITGQSDNYQVGDNENPIEGTLTLSSNFYMDGVKPNDILQNAELKYSFKTNQSQIIQISIYNFTSSSWEQIYSGSHTNFFSGSYVINSKDFYNENFDIKIKFSGSSSEYFKFYLDMLTLSYSWIKNSEDQIYNALPSQPDDFILLYNTNSDWGGTLDIKDNLYSTFISDDATILVISDIELEACKPGDHLDRLNLGYSLKTNISQEIQLYLYNFTSSSWVQIKNSTFIEFTDESYLIPIVRYSEIENETVIYHDFYDADYRLRVGIAGVNTTTNFELYLDMLKIDYEYTPYYFISDNKKIVNSLTEDYINFYSYQPYPNDFPGTYSFENDEVGTVPMGWVDESQNGCSATVIADRNGHNSVLQLSDQSGSNYAKIYTTFTGQEAGAISFWWQHQYTNKYSWIIIYDEDVGEAFKFHTNTLNKIYYHDDSGAHYCYTDVQAGHWYYFEIEFNCSEGWSFWLDGNQKASDTGFITTPTAIDKLEFKTEDGSYQFKMYVDAICFSWTEGFEKNDNKYPTAQINEIIEIDLDQMNFHRFGLFESCKLTYTLDSTVLQEVDLYVYNYVNGTWIKHDSFTTNNINSAQSSCIFSNKAFINENYTVMVKFCAINQSVEEFELNLIQLNAIYNWSKIGSFFGYDDINYRCWYYEAKSTSNLYWYTANTSYENEGEYLITLSADDGYSTSQTGDKIEIIHPNPYGNILSFPNETYKDESIEFESQIFSLGPFANESRFLWSWGDGYYSYTPNPSHAWTQAGVYEITLFVQDCFGNTFTDNETITVLERAPEIIGPFTLYGVEGQAITLDVEVYDSNIDELTLKYRWYNENDELIADYLKPSVILDDGEYLYRLEVEDAEGYVATADISIIVENAPPMVFVSNYMYYGAPGEGPYGLEGIGRLTLNAYAYDSIYDISDLTFEWKIYNGSEVFNPIPFNHQDTTNFIYYKCKDTRIYKGVVSVTDPSGAIGTASFTITSFIDSNSNGLSDEFEEQLELAGETPSLYYDDDNDFLLNWFELGITNTSVDNPDTDGDGLWDGLNEETGIGELSLGTDPRTNDTDGDTLIDSFEFYGWMITTESLGNISVSSDPCYRDTDEDGLDDNEEYLNGTDPRNPDTDGDLLTDGDEIKLYFTNPLKRDTDGDALDDKKEVDIGTDPKTTDTDGDGLSDGEEVLGWGFYTNPLSADSDHDFLADNAEIKTYKFEREKKAKLDKPISLWFKEHVKKPVSAQLAFTITFGEYAEDESSGIEYGVENITSLEISIVKAENDLIVFNTTTNGTKDRYISQVIDLKDFIEKLNFDDVDPETFDYFGEYILMINDTKADCLLEQYELEISKYLDPNDDDYDDDGIMDGVESGMLVRGTDIIDFKDMYWYDERNYAQPQGWWAFDDLTKGSSVAEDSSGNSNDGSLKNMEYDDWIAGKVGPYALSFDGTEEYVEYDAILDDPGDGAFTDTSQEFTITVWINATDLSNSAQSNHGTQNCFIAKAGASTNDNLEIGITNDGRIHVYLDTESQDKSTDLGNAGDIDENNWAFVAVRYNYGNLSVRINNYTYESTAWQGSYTDLDAASGALFTIGRTMDANIYFEGSIDDVRVYNTWLNDANIDWIYNNGTGRSLSPVSSGAQLTTTNSSEAYDEFKIEIPYIGRVFDADLTLKVDSEETPWGDTTEIGTVDIKLIKDDINCSREDAVLIDDSYDICDGWKFIQEFQLDLSDYLANDIISELYGSYILRINVINTNFYELYNFTLSEFYIETDTWVQASSLEDNDAWITDPAKADTDGDGWSDYYEIYLRGDESTNPCSVDTDGDGAWDPNDRDPRRDLIIQIKFIEGKFNHLETKHAPKLQAVVEFEVLNQEFYFTTEPVKATWNKNEFDVPQRASFGHSYYFNVEDDKKVQGNWFNLEFELWWMWPVDDDGNHLGDKRLLADDCDYLIGPEPKEKLFKNGLGNELFVQMATLAIDKCNTIAIYEANSTFNGRYQEQERMNIIQLYVTDSGGAFKAGPNAIVIPTSLFTNTKLNSYMQNEQLEQTPLYSPDENFQFISVDRDKGANSDGSTSKVDFVIIRKEISSSEAMEVLDLLIIGILNESLDENNLTIYEEAKVYSYISTEINGTKAVDMNLAPEVLKYIPWFNIHVNSPQGREPTSKSNVATPTEIIMNFCKDISKGDIIGAFSNAFSSIMLYFSLNPSMGQILAIIMAVIDFLVMLVLTILGPLLWLLIRAALLILIYILIGILICVFTAAIAVIAMLMLPFVLIFNGVIEYNYNNVNASILNASVGMGYEIMEEYNDFLQSNIPYIYVYFSYDSQNFIEMIIKIFPPMFDLNLGDTPLFSGQSSQDQGIDDLLSNLQSNNQNNVINGNTNNKFYNKRNVLNSSQTEDKLKSSADNKIEIIRPYQHEFIDGYITTKIPLNIQYDGEKGDEDIALKYTLYRMYMADSNKEKIDGGYIDPEETSPGNYEYVKEIEFEEDGYYHLVVQAVNADNYSIIEDIQEEELNFIVNDHLRFFMGISFSAKIMTLIFSMVSGIIYGSTPTYGWTGAVAGLVGIICGFGGFYIDFMTSGKENFVWSRSELYGMMFMIVISGALYVSECYFGPFAKWKDLFQMIDPMSVSNMLIKIINSIIWMIMRTQPETLLLAQIRSSLLFPFVLYSWFSVLEITGNMANRKSENFKPNGAYFGFGAIIFGLICIAIMGSYDLDHLSED